MQRITITIDAQLAQDLDKLVDARGYQNRSEAMRDLVRAGIVHTNTAGSSKDCVASLSYVYDPATRELPKRLARAFQEQHSLYVATTRVALDHESMMEVCVLKGPTADVQAFAEKLIAERGIRHGRLALLPASIEVSKHSHGHGHAHPHEHVKV
ncbi:MAG: nickel-responsive transcriptional regulator NikR [Hyphomicrobiaceae bacterium]|nr:nickel-responsive transcriptional regulator NikR [Hyphomicrobiaceae bacterium]